MKATKYILILAALAASANALTSCKDKDDDTTTDTSYRANKEKGERFLQKNRTAEGVRESATGLQFKINEYDASQARPELTDSVMIHLTGSTIDKALFVDTTYTLRIAEQQEWMQEGLRYMTEGSDFDFYVPYYLGFGTQSRSYSFNKKPVKVLPYSALIYNVVLKEVKQ